MESAQGYRVHPIRFLQGRRRQLEGMSSDDKKLAPEGLTSSQEGQEGIISLDTDDDPRIQDDPQTVDTLVHYMYSFAYDSDYENEQQDVAGIVLDVRMYIIADKVRSHQTCAGKQLLTRALQKYFVEPLTQLAIKKFKRHCEDQWYSYEFAQAAQEVYDAQLHRDSELKQAVINTVTANAYELLVASREEEFAELHTVLQSTELGANVAQALVSTSNSVSAEENFCKIYQCPGCQTEFESELGGNQDISCPNGCYTQSGIWWLTYETDEY